MVYRRFASRAFFARVPLLSLLALALILLVLSAHSSPGAHGPNGEHLDMEQSNQPIQRPKFEMFTESFELLGEVFRNELIIYLHDFETNTPIQSASIDLEVGALAASASYDEAQNRYIINDTDFISALNASGEHEVLATILTEDNGDLLVGNFVMHEANAHSDNAEHSHNETHEQEEDHHHFPWWALGLSIVVFALGFFLGRKNTGVKS
ncbi:hypothetical protein [Paraglaciecola sp. 25GB23A]|uniref:hypothetical protein n=1 Tax=Paraglaciecola sp. 25GB23A TaxID=3156068 RepID=UPI0032AEB4C5